MLLRDLLEGKVVQFGMRYRLVVSEEEKYEMSSRKVRMGLVPEDPRHCAKNIADTFKKHINVPPIAQSATAIISPQTTWYQSGTSTRCTDNRTNDPLYSIGARIDTTSCLSSAHPIHPLHSFGALPAQLEPLQNPPSSD